MIGAAIAYNLKKYMNYKEKKVKVVVAMEMVKGKNQSVMNNLFCLFTMIFRWGNFFSWQLTEKNEL